MPLAPFARQPHNGCMASINPKVEFEPLQMGNRVGWYVRVTLPNGKQPNLGGFKTEAEAREWIARELAHWLKEIEDGRYD